MLLCPKPFKITLALCKQDSKLTVASSKFAIRKSHLLPAKNVGSKKFIPGNSVSNFLEEQANFH